MIEGPAPKRKQDRYYINSAGYVVELAEGQEAPHTSGNSLVDWLETVDISHDPEVRSALGENNLFFEQSIGVGESKVLLTGKLESKGWLIDTESENEKLNLSFRLSRSLSREEALEQSVAYIQSKSGPQFRNLTDHELRLCERAAAVDPLQALVLYVANRLPTELSEEFLRIGAAGEDLKLLEFAADENISEILQEGIAHVFYWSHVGADEKFFDYVRANDDGRIWSLSLLESLWNRYRVSSSLEKITQARAEPQPTPEDLEQLSDTEIESLLAESRRLRANNQIR